MLKKQFWLVLAFVVSAVAFPVIGECQSENFTSNVIVHRHENTILPFFNFTIFINDRIAQSSYRNLLGAVRYRDITLNRGETVAIPMNDGTHTIYVKAGPGQSNVITFTVRGSTASFVIAFDEENNMILTQQ